MRTVTFQSVLNGIAILMGMDPNRDLTPVRAASIGEYVNQRMLEAWRYDFWPELMTVEQRTYRLPYAAGTAYAAPTLSTAVEVWHQASQQYYQTVQATMGNPPATLAGLYVENSAYWALSAMTYNGPDWAAGLVFAVGSKARNPDDGRYYQCFTAHTSIGTSMDLTKFGVLTPFSKTIDYAQTGQTPMDAVKRVCKRDPRVYTKNPFPINFKPTGRGVLVPFDAPAVVFVEFRKLPNQFTTVAWSATTTYAAGALSYSKTTGECYASLVGANVNHDPASSPAQWVKVDFPAIFANFVKRAAFADQLKDQKQTDRADSELEHAMEELDAAVSRELESQGAYEMAGVQTYGENNCG